MKLRDKQKLCDAYAESESCNKEPTDMTFILESMDLQFENSIYYH